jgi:hypothetical protein
MLLDRSVRSPGNRGAPIRTRPSRHRHTFRQPALAPEIVAETASQLRDSLPVVVWFPGNVLVLLDPVDDQLAHFFAGAVDDRRGLVHGEAPPPLTQSS